ncbi:hypothetical protein N657DRAFT_320617 [Parathielavia appendiculata]|uniref:DUF7580 domain-containing protein n=1 Tax=Parathielavia appendiculata TaxID=2587402 RepID=A0AAN6YYN4_9PEZI|nr:hypothetical protein N657DRAFT_320617 [Parathielavia appendiculata]
MDPISLSLGIAPLAIAALKGAKHTKSKVKQIKHHKGEISRFRKRFKTQVSIFRDESQLLLQDAGVDRDMAADMVQDYSHSQWTRPALECQIRAFLDKKYPEVKQVTEEIRDQIANFDKELSNLEDSTDESSDRGKAAVTVRRARKAVGIAVKHSALENGIESLTDSVNEFRRLRKTAKELQAPRVPCSKQRKAMPRTYSLVARHSASFLESLTRSWSCLNSNGLHSTHTAKLFLESDASNSCVNFRTILEYEAISGDLRQHSLLFLRIRSEELSWVDLGLPPPVASSSRSSFDAGEPPAKTRRVRFADSPSESSARLCQSSETDCQRRDQALPLARNLCQAKDVCQHVFECAKTLYQSRQEGCVGYLVSTDNLTHRLMAAQDKESTAIQTRPCPPASLASIIQPARETSISIHEQLRLALRLARSVLQYHSTPWWRRNWCLSDLSYFEIDEELSTSLATLHIDAKLVSRTDHLAMQGVLTQVPTAPLDDQAEMLCGIRNVTLHSLGVALLQIGRWECLDTEDIIAVRKAASKPSRLGPRYDELTTRCLYCDFGFGADLNKPQLQGAIYENVVYELEQMVGLLEGSGASGVCS